jgi:type I restriction enzyme S subunit
VGLIPENGPYKEYIISNKQLKLRIDHEKYNSKFLYYYFSLPQMVQHINDIAIGSAVPGINLGLLKGIKICLPPKSQQDDIAAILSSYDDLIENNKRRIELLEKMADEIYREWFIRFRFPGYETAEFEKGIPKEWEVAKAEKLFSHVKGKSYKSNEITAVTEDSMPFITLKSFNRGGGYREDGLKRYTGPYRKEQIVHEGDVIMAVTDMTQEREVVGRVARIPELDSDGAVISLDVIKLVPHGLSNTYLYCYMRYSGFGHFIKVFANGANVLHLKPDLVTQQEISVPPKELRNKFDALVSPIHKQMNSLSKHNKVLEQTKLSILPRLISGKLSVEDMDIQFPPSMQK